MGGSGPKMGGGVSPNGGKVPQNKWGDPKIVAKGSKIGRAESQNRENLPQNGCVGVCVCKMGVMCPKIVCVGKLNLGGWVFIILSQNDKELPQNIAGGVPK